MPNTSFTVSTDAYGFENTWQLADSERDDLTSAFGTGVGAAVAASVAPYVAAFGLIGYGVDFLASKVLTTFVLNKLVSAFDPDFGLCGGMAYSALDYYMNGWVVPRGAQPNHASLPYPAPDRSTVESTELREYIIQRQVDSLSVDGVKFIHAKILYFAIPGGRTILRKLAQDEWRALKHHLDAGQPWPIGLVGGNVSLFADHQALATGYAEMGGGAIDIALYDSNQPLVPRHVVIDFSQNELAGHGYDEDRSPFDGSWLPLRHFFCHTYRQSGPPVAVGVTSRWGGFHVHEPPPYHVGEAPAFGYEIVNRGYGAQPRIALAVFGGPKMWPRQIIPRPRETPEDAPAAPSTPEPGTPV